MHPLSDALRARIRCALSLRDRLLCVAVTGTNGKSTSTAMIGHIVAASGQPEATVTTLGMRIAGNPFMPPFSDPALRRTLLPFALAIEEAVARGVQIIAVEMTSLALSRGAAVRWPPDIAVFTNITRDHLDVHKTPEAYFLAKARLFQALRPGGLAVLNADDPASERLRGLLPADTRVVSFSLGQHDATLVARHIDVGIGRTVVELAPGEVADALGGRLMLGVTGRVHVANALGAALAALGAGIPAYAVKVGLESFRGLSGRFEEIVHPDGQATASVPRVFVDYAHTPDGLEQTLTTARELVGEGPGRVICVFGCGGERDRGKRPMMGAVADRLADRVVLTSDNPRHEDPFAIARDVEAGVTEPKADWLVEIAREAAIHRAISEAFPEDIVIIAGKGHEVDQRVGRRVVPFSDADIARAALMAWR